MRTLISLSSDRRVDSEFNQVLSFEMTLVLLGATPPTIYVKGTFNFFHKSIYESLMQL